MSGKPTLIRYASIQMSKMMGMLVHSVPLIPPNLIPYHSASTFTSFDAVQRVIAVVVLANYGSDSHLSKRECGYVALGTCPSGSSVPLVTISLSALGIGAGMENGADAWDVRRVWGGEGVEDWIIVILGLGLIRRIVIWGLGGGCAL